MAYQNMHEYKARKDVAVYSLLQEQISNYDNMADVFSVTFENDIPVGTQCQGWFVRGDKSTVPIEGNVDGKVASVVLPPNCYTVPGRFALTVKLVNGAVVTSVLVVEGSVRISRTDALAPAGDKPYSFDELVSAVENVGSEMKRRDRVYNLLDNSNFAMPVNQRGEISYSRNGYTIDRWKITNSTTRMDVNDGYITVKALNDGLGYFRQQFSKPLTSDVFTLAACVRGTGQGRMYFTTANGSSGTGSVIFGASSDWQIICLTSDAASGTVVPDQFTFRADDANGFDIKWAALYEGEYTADNLPPYMPKGYGTELAECMRYFYVLKSVDAAGYNTVMNGIITSGGKSIAVPLETGTKMRLSAPTISFTGSITVRGVSGYCEDASYNTPYENPVFAVNSSDGGRMGIEIRKTDGTAWNGISNNTLVGVTFVSDSVLTLTAEP